MPAPSYDTSPSLPRLPFSSVPSCSACEDAHCGVQTRKSSLILTPWCLFIFPIFPVIIFRGSYYIHSTLLDSERVGRRGKKEAVDV